jgi:hypothetical protein
VAAAKKNAKPAANLLLKKGEPKEKNSKNAKEKKPKENPVKNKKIYYPII